MSQQDILKRKGALEKKIKSPASTSPASDALKNLKDALDLKKASALEKDGTVQRFEYSYEMIWKLGQRVLKDNEVFAESPKTVFKELGRLGWIENVEDWIEFQRSRNETNHEYGAALAKKSLKLARRFYPLAKQLLKILLEKSVRE